MPMKYMADAVQYVMVFCTITILLQFEEECLNAVRVLCGGVFAFATAP